MLAAQPQSKSTINDDLQGHGAAVGSVADHTLPTSTHTLAQDMPDIASMDDNAIGPSCLGLPKSYSTGHLSVQSHGSSMHVEGLASADDAGRYEQAETTQAFVPADFLEPPALNAFHQDANTVLDKLSQEMSKQDAGACSMHTEEELTEACFSDTVTCCCLVVDCR